jgi:hypothetical protein
MPPPSNFGLEHLPVATLDLVVLGRWPGFVRQAENLQAEQPVALQPGLPAITGEAKAAGLGCA